MNRLARLLDFARPPVVLPPRAAYELWAETYPASAHNPLMRTEQDVVASLLTSVRASRALDVGTGSGRYLPFLAKTGAVQVVGVDWSRAMLTRCRESLTAGCTDPSRLVCGDACRLPFRTGAFDIVNASLMVGDIHDLRGLGARGIAHAQGQVDIWSTRISIRHGPGTAGSGRFETEPAVHMRCRSSRTRLTRTWRRCKQPGCRSPPSANRA